MSHQRSPFSLGALALVLCIALPTGVLSLFSEVTTGEEVDRADAILVGRVTGMQYEADADQTYVSFAVSEAILGNSPRGRSTFRFEGRAPLRVGDDAVLMIEGQPAEVIGHLVVHKSPWTSQREIVTPISGMVAQGLVQRLEGASLGGASGVTGNISLDQFQSAVLVRRGMLAPGAALASSALPPPPTGITVPADPFEPNNDLASAPTIAIGQPFAITGLPTLLTDLTLSRDDVDFFFVDTLPLGQLHAKTFDTAGNIDTVLGIFDGVTGELLAFNDDDPSGGKFSRLILPTQNGGLLAVAVAPFADTDFNGTGANPANLGSYGLSLEASSGQYLWNQIDQMLGLSQDGTFIEDGVGYREFDRDDLLLPGMRGDGWGLRFMLGMLPSGVSEIYGGAGDHLVPPEFTHETLPSSFKISQFQDAAGLNRRGLGKAVNVVTQHATMPFHGVGVEFVYAWSFGSQTLMGSLTFLVPTQQSVSDVLFTRLLDVDLFGEGADSFYWSFDPGAKAKAFAVDLAASVSAIPVPASRTGGPVLSDLQAAIRIDHGDEGDISNGRVFRTIYPMAFTLVSEEPSEVAARDVAIANLQGLGMTTWVIAVDQDPQSGTYTAFGVGLADP